MRTHTLLDRNHSRVKHPPFTMHRNPRLRICGCPPQFILPFGRVLQCTGTQKQPTVFQHRLKRFNKQYFKCLGVEGLSVFKFIETCLQPVYINGFTFLQRSEVCSRCASYSCRVKTSVCLSVCPTENIWPDRTTIPPSLQMFTCW
jgi:hypothetical protein